MNTYKKSMLIFLNIFSFLISAALCVTVFSSILSAKVFDITPDAVRQLTFFLTLICVLPCSFGIHVILRRIISRLTRRYYLIKSSASMIKSAKQNEGEPSSNGGTVFQFKDDDTFTVVKANLGFWELTGKQPDPLSGRKISFLRCIHPDDVENVRKVILDERSGPVLQQIDFRILRRNGEIRWCKLCGVREKSRLGESQLIDCIAIDITESKNAERDLMFEKERYRLLLKDTTAAVWEYDVESDSFCMANWNSNEGKFLPVPDFRDSLVRTGTIHPDFIEEFHGLCDGLRSGAPVIDGEMRIKSSNGNYCWFSVYGTPLLGSNGKVLRYSGHIKNIDEKYERREESQNEKSIDPLSRFFDRYGFESVVKSLLIHGNGINCPLFLIDIDRFSPISKRLGHLFGDALLIELSEALKNIFPKKSIFGRIIDDQFAVFVPVAFSEDQIANISEKVCRCLEHCFLNTEKTETVTCSVGISRLTSNSGNYKELFYEADVALCCAKFNGRNTYRIFTEGMDEQLSSIPAVRQSKPAPKTVEASSDSVLVKSTDLISRSVDILFESRELSSSINIIISLLGRRYHLDRIAILEFSDDFIYARPSYIWRSESVEPIPGEHDIVPVEDIEPFILYGPDDDYFFCNDVNEIFAERPDLQPICQKHGIHALLEAPIREGLTIRGCVYFAFCGDKHKFTEESLHEITLITKIMTGYLIKLRTQQDIDRITYSDRLTGAMNFNRFKLEADRIIRENPGVHYSMVCSDIDRFKFINEIYGYKAGDDVLISVAEILRSSIKEGELFARMTADKFLLFLREDSEDIIRSRLAAMHDRIALIKKTDKDNYLLPMRSGIYIMQNGENNISTMLDKANLARKSMKNVHVSTIVFFDESMKSRIMKQKEIEDVMQDALHRKEFVVYFQPKFSLMSGKVAGAEALVRWYHPDKGMLPPDDFIPIFEDNGFIIDLDFYVFEAVCQKLHNDLRRGLHPITVSVNFSRVHLGSEDFVERIRQIITKHNIPPHLIEIEITESAFTDHEDRLAALITSLHDLGLVVSMDDFGSGYSSLNLLKKLPVDVLKIDKDFFAGSNATDREKTIISNVVNMARSLNMKVVSEGVETEEQAAFLRGIRCDLAQGFLFARPMDIPSFERRYQISA